MADYDDNEEYEMESTAGDISDADEESIIDPNEVQDGEEEEKKEQEDNEEDEEIEPEENAEREKIYGIKHNLRPYQNKLEKIGDNEYIRCLQIVASLIEDSMLIIPEEHRSKIVGNTGESHKMAYRMMEMGLEVPLKIKRSCQGYDPVKFDYREYCTRKQLESRDIDADNEISFTERYFSDL